MTKTGEREIAKKENVNGGAGYVLMEALLNEKNEQSTAESFHR